MITAALTGALAAALVSVWSHLWVDLRTCFAFYSSAPH